jgi:hypothetical protein
MVQVRVFNLQYQKKIVMHFNEKLMNPEFPPSPVNMKVYIKRDGYTKGTKIIKIKR